MFFIDTRSRVPIYEQLKQNIITLVSNGVLVPDDQLPSVRALARDLGVNPNTVQKAYQDLEQHGFIYQAVGRGSFISACDSLTKSLSSEKMASLKECILDCKAAGILKVQIIAVVEEIFNGGDSK